MHAILAVALIVSSFGYIAPRNTVQSSQPFAGTDGFKQVEGASFQARFNAAKAMGSSNRSFWIGYQFDLKPGVGIDIDWKNQKGIDVHDDGFSVTTDAEKRTEHAGILFYYNPELSKIYVRDLDRRRTYKEPVYWLGMATTSESLALLEPLATGGGSEHQIDRAIAAIGLHAGNEGGQILERIVRSSASFDAREKAVTWLGIAGGHSEFLAGIVSDNQASREMRKKAATALGISADPAAFPTLKRLYDTLRDGEIRREILVAIARSRK